MTIIVNIAIHAPPLKSTSP